ncbi:MAG: molybdate ABC transporter substrate-binding protein, partial [Pseudomonadota bacterium]
EETRFTYAVGALALYSPHPEARLGPDVFSAEFRTLAIANPATAPYGRAARQTLERLGVWEALQPRLALSPNVSAAYTVAAVGAAEFALVAVSLLEAPGRRVGGAFWRVPAALYDPIRQDAVLLAEGAENMVAAAFLAHLQSPEGRAVIAAHGYRSAP